jgi:bifunctional oligoribonuclease and PAP phosphatase NrnA
MRKNDFASVVDVLRGAESFLVTSHGNPDGDAVGSMLATSHFLRELGKSNITLVNDDPVPTTYRWLPGADTIVPTNTLTSPIRVDVAVIVDAARKNRVGNAGELIPETSTVVVLDHHLEDGSDGDVAIADAAYAAVGEIIVDLYGEAGIPLSRDAAVCAYVSIATDTGGFRYANTTPHAHRAAAILMEAGIDVAETSSRVFDVISAQKFELLRRVLDHTLREVDGRIAYSTVTAADMSDTFARIEDVEGLVNYPRNIEGVDVGILFREIDSETTKVSMRSRDTFNCARFLAQFGGGGHAAAAGVTMNLPLESACRVVVEGVRTQMLAL